MALPVKGSGQEYILDCLNRAANAILEEQELYHKVVERAEEYITDDKVKQKLLSGGWKAVLDIMADCSCPPDDDEREKHLMLSKDKFLHNVKLAEIRDGLVRGMAGYLTGIAEHTQRMRSMAMFVERIGTLHGKWGGVFDYWAYRASLVIIQDEAKQMGMKERGKVLGRVINASDKIADIIFEDVWNDTPPASNGQGF